jgi:hypothetical protein
MDEKIVNIYFDEPALPSTTMFHFMYSLRPFIMAEGPKVGEIIFVDLLNNSAYTWDDLALYDLHFYGADGKERDDDDDEFYGVAVIGEI